jgi:hypothetical protein
MCFGRTRPSVLAVSERLAHTATRKENAMFGRASFAIVAALGALLLAAPAVADNWGADRYDDGGVTAMLDARERSFEAKQVATPAPDKFERFAAANSTREPVVDDRFRIEPTSTPLPDAVPSARELEWPQIAVGLALGVLLGLGLVLAVRIVDVRPRQRADTSPIA